MHSSNENFLNHFCNNGNAFFFLSNTKVHVHLYLAMKMTIVFDMKLHCDIQIIKICTNKSHKIYLYRCISEFNYKTAIWDSSKTISSAPAIVMPLFLF